ncbi:T9SS C-terminal target domain-containing protein [Kaistella antarctica]|uniref:Gliding motility-associated C-terminal domain n=1 Tax=Kaistella antarctica TaxID=266748 RepID=A0A448NUD1_9FLAO|nr:T9SS C-terminal target domain-containing protein [Kaistella antarctica]KEY18472.1 hypothetical protein HY04_08115 [Kaistella antarctica]SEV86092.1 gliding motility-associated C-terminal domain-containing protein [Kaistella antarctica]VEI01268.1 gliding motility-associated C-terminal domain [Kaistella antarctica]
MKKIILFLFSFIFVTSFAQLDREHWFAPMYDGQGNGSPEQYLHLSTNETSAFKVLVYSNNAVVYTRTISKGNPAIIKVYRDYIITKSKNDLHTVGNRGLYIQAEKPCFANLRFRVANHAEIITSKGTAGIGTKFYTVVAPNAQVNNNLGFGASFLATENNTTVTVNNFKKNLYFNDYGLATDFTFTLNKGESYIIDGRSTNAENLNGFIGATVTSDKPISMSNGNFNGQYATSDLDDGSDILMDQSVPVDKLGDEFVIVKGYGAIGNNMEGAIVVATEKNTSLYVNDSTVPIATLANEGDYYLIDESNYTLRGSDHYNLHIKTDKNVYVYQLLGGVESGSSPLATGGMNYIPPLNCYLPKKIDELSYISRIAQTDSDNTFLTKLNIITQQGAVVKVNGIIPDAQYGPYEISTITANQTWVTYSIPEVKGNLTIESSKAVTAGIASGNNAFGYGGYFAGFSAIPLILKTEGDCLQNSPPVKLAVTEGFDSYLWLIQVNGVFVPAPVTAQHPSNSEFEYFPTQAGIYAVKVQQGTCPEIQTADFKFYNCTTYTNYDFTTCTEQLISPEFALSSQTINNTTLKIDTPPTKGNVVINADGTITYTANPNAIGTDTFKFSFCGNGAISDCETVQATITLNQIEKYNVPLGECSETGSATYDLREAAVTPDSTVSKTYYETEAGAENEIAAEVINNFANFTSVDRFVWVRMKNTFGCVAVARIELKVKLPADVKPELYTKSHCDEDIDGVLDGIYKVDVTSITPSVLQTPSNHIVRYYDTEIKANAGSLTDNIKDIFSFTANRSIWIRVEPKNGCPIIVEKISILIGTKLILDTVAPDTICDDDLDGKKMVHLSNYISDFNNEADVTATYFLNLKDALNNENSIPEEVEVKNAGTYYLRLQKPRNCAEIGSLNLKIKIPKNSLKLVDKNICPLVIMNLDAGEGFSDYLWSNNSKEQSIDVPAGDYWVDLTFEGCTYRQKVSVKTVLLPVIKVIEIQGGTITVLVTGGNPPYQYSLDGSTYQSSNVFNNVPPGNYTVYVISADECVPTTTEINILRILNVITPNDDGKNDVLNYDDLLRKDNPYLQIFDRYGVSVFKGDKNNSFSWDGKSAGKLVGTGSYWYVLQWQEPGSATVTKLTGWVLVKTRN